MNDAVGTWTCVGFSHPFVAYENNPLTHEMDLTVYPDLTFELSRGKARELSAKQSGPGFGTYTELLFESSNSIRGRIDRNGEIHDTGGAFLDSIPIYFWDDHLIIMNGDPGLMFERVNGSGSRRGRRAEGF